MPQRPRSLSLAPFSARRGQTWRRLRAHARYLRRPLRQFLPLFAGIVLLVLLGGVSFHLLYDREKLGFGHALYVTYCLIFMQPTLPFPDHWLLEAFCVILPPLGLVVILDGIVRFSYHILRRDDMSPEWVGAMASTMQNHVILFGLGKLGVRVLAQLLHLGDLVVAVEKDPQCPHLAYAKQHGVPVIIGTGREADILARLNCKDAKSIILATDDDLANLEVALDARKIKPDIRVVLRMFDQELAAKIKEAFDIQLAFSTTEIAAPLFATASSDRSIMNSFYVGDRLMLVAAISVEPASALAGMTVARLRDTHATFVLDLERAGGRTMPAADTAIAAGDRLIVQCEAGRLQAVHALNRAAVAAR
jgi:Trk K+ transport system NAD-binding subunit